jgi:hypothetical protein
MRVVRYIAARRFSLIDTFFLSLIASLGWRWEAAVVLLIGAACSVALEMAVEKNP